MLVFLYFFFVSVVLISSEDQEFCKFSVKNFYHLRNLKVCRCEFVLITNVIITDKVLKFVIVDSVGNVERLEIERIDKLVSKDTDVLIVENSSEFCQTTLGEFAPEIENFKVYGNEESSVLVYYDGDSIFVEGTVRKKILRRINSLAWNTVHYVYAKILPDDSGHCSVDKLDLEHDFGVDLEEINVNLMVVLDGNIINIDNMESNEALKRILLYFIDIQLLFSRFKSPWISFSIKKFIIPRDNEVPYIGSNPFYMSDITRKIDEFAEENEQDFNINKYDLIIFLMTHTIIDKNEIYNSISFFEHKICDSADRPTIILSKYVELDYYDFLWMLLFRFGVEVQQDTSIIMFEPFAQLFDGADVWRIPSCKITFNGYLRDDKCHYKETKKEVKVRIVLEERIKELSEEELDIYRYFVD